MVKFKISDSYLYLETDDVGLANKIIDLVMDYESE